MPTNIDGSNPSRVRGLFGRLSMSDWLSLIQLLALLVAGGWTLYVFNRFEAREKAIGQQKALIELKKLQAIPLQFDQDISISPFGANTKKEKGKLTVDYRYSIANISNHVVAVRLISVHCFVLGAPDKVKNPVSEIPPLTVEGQRSWKKVFSKGYVIDSEWNEGGVLAALDGSELTPDKYGGTGVLDPSETSWGSLSLLVNSSVGDYIGFRLELTMKFEDGTEKVQYLTQYARLKEGDYVGTPRVREAEKKSGRE